MKTAKESTVNIVVIIISLIVFGLSFADFYTITRTGSVIDEFTGKFVQSTENNRNSLVSIVCVLPPFISFIVKKRWTRILAISVSIVNFFIVTRIYPFLVTAMSMIGSSYSAELTSIGWIAASGVLLIAFLLFYKEYALTKLCKNEEKVGKEE